MFDLAVWRRCCQKLYPATLTKLLNGIEAQLPAKLEKGWQPFARLPFQQKRLGGRGVLSFWRDSY